MAVVKYGSVVTEMHGKLGGHVFQKCGQSFALRTNAAKTPSNSILSHMTRGQFSALANYWNTIAAASKETWSTYASTYPTVDRFGNPIVLTGYQLFMYLNRTALMLGKAIVATCATYIPSPACGLSVLSADASSNELLITGSSAIPFYCQGYIMASACQRSDANQTWPKLIYIGDVGYNSSYPFNMYAAFLAKHPNGLGSGARIYYEAYTVTSYGISPTLNTKGYINVS